MWRGLGEMTVCGDFRRFGAEVRRAAGKLRGLVTLLALLIL
jgi:hypothetical protein